MMEYKVRRRGLVWAWEITKPVHKSGWAWTKERAKAAASAAFPRTKGSHPISA